MFGQRLPLGNADVAGILHLVPQRLEPGLELCDAQRRGTHVDAAAAGPEIERNTDDADATHAWLQVGGHVDSAWIIAYSSRRT